MTAMQMRQRAKKAIVQLSGPRLRFVTEFLTYFQGRGRDRATRELLEIPRFIRSLRAAMTQSRFCNAPGRAFFVSVVGMSNLRLQACLQQTIT